MTPSGQQLAMGLSGPVTCRVREIDRATVGVFTRVRLYHGFAADHESVIGPVRADAFPEDVLDSGRLGPAHAPTRGRFDRLSSLTGLDRLLPSEPTVAQVQRVRLLAQRAAPPSVPRECLGAKADPLRQIWGTDSIEARARDPDARVGLLAAALADCYGRGCYVETPLTALTRPVGQTRVLCCPYSHVSGESPPSAAAAATLGGAIRHAHVDTYRALFCTPETRSLLFLEWTPASTEEAFVGQLERSSRTGFPATDGESAFGGVIYGPGAGVPNSVVVFSHATALPPVLYHRRLGARPNPDVLLGADLWQLVVDYALLAWPHMLWTDLSPAECTEACGHDAASWEGCVPAAALFAAVPKGGAEENGVLPIELFFTPLGGVAMDPEPRADGADRVAPGRVVVRFTAPEHAPAPGAGA